MVKLRDRTQAPDWSRAATLPTLTAPPTIVSRYITWKFTPCRALGTLCQISPIQRSGCRGKDVRPQPRARPRTCVPPHQLQLQQEFAQALRVEEILSDPTFYRQKTCEPLRGEL